MSKTCKHGNMIVFMETFQRTEKKLYSSYYGKTQISNTCNQFHNYSNCKNFSNWVKTERRKAERHWERAALKNYNLHYIRPLDLGAIDTLESSRLSLPLLQQLWHPSRHYEGKEHQLGQQSQTPGRQATLPHKDLSKAMEKIFYA